MIIDASVLLCAFFPDENQPRAQTLIRDHVAGAITLKAPSLLLYEVTNAAALTVRRGRISSADANAILTAFEGLGIETLSVPWQQILTMAQRFDRSAYDAAYLALAEASGEPMITADKRLYNAVHGELKWVRWIGET